MPKTYTKTVYTGDVLPAGMATKLDKGEAALEAAWDRLDLETTAGKAMTQAANAAAQVALLPASTASADGKATAAQITKLDGIEAAADVTDEANVTAIVVATSEVTAAPAHWLVLVGGALKRMTHAGWLTLVKAAVGWAAQSIGFTMTGGTTSKTLSVDADAATYDIPDGALMPMSLNLFNKDDPDVLIGSYYNASGVLVTNALFNQSGFIPVTAGEKYTAANTGFGVVWYNSAKEYLSGTSSTDFYRDKYVTAPANAAYARFMDDVATWSSGFVSHGQYGSYTPYVAPVRILGSKIAVSGASIVGDETLDGATIKPQSILPTSADFLEVGPNLFDRDDPDVLIGHYINSSGVLITDATSCMTGFIPVTAGLAYAPSTPDYFATFWGPNKEFLGRVNFAGGHAHAPTGAAYGRFIGYAASWSTFYVNQADSPQGYSPFGYKFPLLIETYTGLSGKKYASLGDSITYRNMWQPAVAAAFGLTHTNCGVGSSQLAGPVSATYPCFWEPSRISAVETADPDILTIMGGANDHGGHVTLGTPATEFAAAVGDKDTDTFYGAYSFIIETLLTWKPALRIFLMPTMWGSTLCVPDGTTGLTNYDYATAARVVAAHYGLPVIDVDGETGLNAQTAATLLSDTVHPNQTCADRMAIIVKNKFHDVLI